MNINLLDSLREQDEHGVLSPKKREIQSCAWKILKVLEEVGTYLPKYITAAPSLTKESSTQKHKHLGKYLPFHPAPQKSQMSGAIHPPGFQAKQRIICTFAAEHVCLQYQLHM